MTQEDAALQSGDAGEFIYSRFSRQGPEGCTVGYDCPHGLWRSCFDVRATIHRGGTIAELIHVFDLYDPVRFEKLKWFEWKATATSPFECGTTPTHAKIDMNGLYLEKRTEELSRWSDLAHDIAWQLFRHHVPPHDLYEYAVTGGWDHNTRQLLIRFDRMDLGTWENRQPTREFWVDLDAPDRLKELHAFVLEEIRVDDLPPWCEPCERWLGCMAKEDFEALHDSPCDDPKFVLGLLGSIALDIRVFSLHCGEGRFGVTASCRGSR